MNNLSRHRDPEGSILIGLAYHVGSVHPPLPTTVTDNDQVTILWDMGIHTDREITANRQDIVKNIKILKSKLKECGA